jgi:hypothetical protein
MQGRRLCSVSRPAGIGRRFLVSAIGVKRVGEKDSHAAKDQKRNNYRHAIPVRSGYQ